MDKVYVTGMGVISAIGNSVAESYASLSESRTGVGPLTYLDTIFKDEFVAGEIKHSNDELVSIAGIGDYNRATLLSMIAAREALKQADITDVRDARTGFISSTTAGGMNYTEQHYKAFYSGVDNKTFIESYSNGIGPNEVPRILGITDYVTTISTACSSAANAIMLGARLIRNGVLDRAIVGGVDSLSKFTLNGFKTLMILDNELCKPFDEGRKGLNLGEGAAYLVLESEKMVAERKKPTIARIAGYGNANDAYHATASSPEGLGAFLAMRNAISVAKLDPTRIDYINAHGTGTPNNDLSEGMAMQTIFNNAVPRFSSTKAFTGHALAAAAAIEAVISILAMRHSMIFPCLNSTRRMEELSISPVGSLERDVPVNFVMSNSFGFGGNCSSLIFAKE